MLFRSLSAELVGFAIHYLEGQDQAEEVVQETFARIWSKLDETEIHTTAKSYLYGAVRHACLNEIKHQKVVQKHVDIRSRNNRVRDICGIGNKRPGGV